VLREAPHVLAPGLVHALVLGLERLQEVHLLVKNDGWDWSDLANKQTMKRAFLLFLNRSPN